MKCTHINIDGTKCRANASWISVNGKSAILCEYHIRLQLKGKAPNKAKGEELCKKKSMSIK
jgi:hypothetical protein